LPHFRIHMSGSAFHGAKPMFFGIILQNVHAILGLKHVGHKDFQS